MYKIFDKTMTDIRVYIVILLNVWVIVAIEMILSRLYDWRVLKMELKQI